MENPFDQIIKRLEAIENKLSSITAAPPKDEIEIINRDELCKRLALTEPTVIIWEKKGKIPCFRIGASVRYDWKQVLIAIGAKTKNTKKQ